MVKASSKEVVAQASQISPSIFLDKTDLFHLTLLGCFSQAGRLPNPKAGISFPRHQLTAPLHSLLNNLEELGRIRVKNISARHSLSPSTSGNIVVQPIMEDDTVMAAFRGVGLDALRPILDFVGRFPSSLLSATLFPNISGRSLKGIGLQFDQRHDEKWWHRLAPYRWPLGRGLSVVALPIGMEQAVDQSEAILSTLIGIGKTSPSMKYIRLFCGPDQRVFLVLSDGPSFAERQDISNQLANIHRPQKVLDFMDAVNQSFYNRREEALRSMMGSLGLQGEERVIDVPYIFIDVETGNAVSGGVKEGELMPLMLRNGMIIHRDPSDNVLPLGLPRVETGKSIPGFISNLVLDNYLGTLKDPLPLTDLAAVYHRSKT